MTIPEPYCCKRMYLITINNGFPLRRSWTRDNSKDRFLYGPCTIMMDLGDYTQTGALSKRGRSSAILYFCPFCGKQIHPDAPESRAGGAE